MPEYSTDNLARRALVVFARRPERGKVKTRLAASVGEDKALEIYIRLLCHTREVIRQVDCDPHIFLTEPAEDGFWQGFQEKLQTTGDLGERMQAAFSLLFEQGYNKVMIIGSDCPHLQAAHIITAFEALERNDIIIGPAMDGGYYLLAMKQLWPTLFRNKNWSTSEVLAQTMTDIQAQHLSCYQLPVLSDVDEAADVPAGWL